MKKNIRVFAFPIDKYVRDVLAKKTDKELLALIHNDKDVLDWGDLKTFENTLNDEEVLSLDYWVKFVEVN